MLQNTLMLGIFSISAYQDYKKRKINLYYSRHSRESG